MERVQYTCDVCGRTKKVANHWWVMRIQGRRILQIGPWEVAMLEWTFDPMELEHVCGQECVIHRLSEFMSPEAPPRPQLVEPPPAEVSSTQENSEQAQPQWTEGGPILTEEPKAE